MDPHDDVTAIDALLHSVVAIAALHGAITPAMECAVLSARYALRAMRAVATPEDAVIAYEELRYARAQLTRVVHASGVAFLDGAPAVH